MKFWNKQRRKGQHGTNGRTKRIKRKTNGELAMKNVNTMEKRESQWKVTKRINNLVLEETKSWTINSWSVEINTTQWQTKRSNVAKDAFKDEERKCKGRRDERENEKERKKREHERRSEEIYRVKNQWGVSYERRRKESKESIREEERNTYRKKYWSGGAAREEKKGEERRQKLNEKENGEDKKKKR